MTYDYKSLQSNKRYFFINKYTDDNHFTVTYQYRYEACRLADLVPDDKLIPFWNDPDTAFSLAARKAVERMLFDKDISYTKRTK